jgi:hypothetical protein
LERADQLLASVAHHRSQSRTHHPR